MKADRYQPLRDALATGHTAGGLVFGADSDTIAALLAENTRLRAAAEAAIAYDKAIQRCANNPASMATFCTAEGEDLDALYDAWISKARAALADGEASNG